MQQFHYSLLSDKTTDKSDDRRIGRQSKFLPLAAQVLRVKRHSIKSPNVNAIAEKHDFLPRTDALPDCCLNIFTVLGEDDVRATGGDLFCGNVKPAPSCRHVVVKVKAVQRVHYDGNTCHSRRELT